VSVPGPAQGTPEVAVSVDWAAHLSVSTVRTRAHSGLCRLAIIWPGRIEACRGCTFSLTTSETAGIHPLRSPNRVITSCREESRNQE
jgi:hypothetical protein